MPCRNLEPCALPQREPPLRSPSKDSEISEIKVYEIPVSNGLNFQACLKSGHEVCLRNFGTYGLLEICELVCDHVPKNLFIITSASKLQLIPIHSIFYDPPDPPGLVLSALPQRGHH